MADSDDDPDQQAAADIPATYVDGYYLNWWSNNIRVAFSEHLGGKHRFRMAVVMPLEDAESLARDLLAAVEERKSKNSKAP